MIPGTTVSRLPALRQWPLWKLPGWLPAFVLAVVAADLAAIAAAGAVTPVHGHDLELFGILLGCNLVTTGMIRGPSEPMGLTKDMNAVWELPLALLLPPLYGLLAPIPRYCLVQWRFYRSGTHRRVYSGAALGLSYAAASLAFHAITPALATAVPSPQARALAWCGSAIACGILHAAVNYALVVTAVKTASPAFSIRSALFSRESLASDGAELSVAAVIAYTVMSGPLMALFALPFVPLLRRSVRHGQLLGAARTDGKTGLLNAVTWQQEARRMIDRAARAGAPAAVAVIDIDHFKAVNDTHGHQAGDTVLAAVAKAIRGLLRDCDLCGRIGGEEFAVLLPLTGPREARLIAERLRERIAATVIAAGNGTQARVRVTVSIGLCLLDGARSDLDSLLAAADHALYAAKREGRNAVRVTA